MNHSRFFASAARDLARTPRRPLMNIQYAQRAIPAENLNHNVTREEKDHFDQELARNKTKQIRTPWHREGSDKPPVRQPRSASAMTKGKLLTTPSRMLKLILPLTTKDYNFDRKDVEPLALLVHPQQPLSYLERLIQSELPMIRDGDKDRTPNVWFRAEDSAQSSIDASKKQSSNKQPGESEGQENYNIENPDEQRIDGKVQKTGKINSQRIKDSAAAKAGGDSLEDDVPVGLTEGAVETFSGQGREAPPDPPGTSHRFVRWSNSTEIGDFIRDAARGREFSVEIERAPNEIKVGVPSFNDRTYYLRMRLRTISKRISSMADLKKECDMIAHNHAKRVAMSGFAGLCGWWGGVYWLTFQTELGWDVMEPVTYLVGLSTLIGGYVWFLYHNREVSYRSAMNITISRRQAKLYESKGFDLPRWETLIEDANSLRKEVKAVASEYDVDWDETKDEADEKVAEALRQERRKKKEKGNKDEDGDEEGGKD